LAASDWECRKAVAPNQVRTFVYDNYVGSCKTYTLASGRRHLSIKNLMWYDTSQKRMNSFHSIKIGGNLEVMLFPETKLIVGIHYNPEYVTGNITKMKKYYYSMIIYPKGRRPPGIWLRDKAMRYFFPVSEYQNTMVSKHGSISTMYKPSNLVLTSGLAVQLFEYANFQGRSIILPGAGDKRTSFNLWPYNLAGVGSIKMVREYYRAKLKPFTRRRLPIKPPGDSIYQKDRPVKVQ
jgi:hypothetical protein